MKFIISICLNSISHFFLSRPSIIACVILEFTARTNAVCFSGSLSAVCSCTAPLYDNIRQDLFGHLEDILEFNVSSMDSNSLCNLLLFGKPDLDVSVNKMIIEETIRFIENTKRL